MTNNLGTRDPETPPGTWGREGVCHTGTQTGPKNKMRQTSVAARGYLYPLPTRSKEGEHRVPQRELGVSGRQW